MFINQIFNKMKKSNIYFHTVYGRTNVIKVWILNFFLAFSSWPRVFIEVFTRKHFGERYFLYSLCLLIAAIMAIAPFGMNRYAPIMTVIGKNLTWYIYLVAFVIASFKRNIEVQREPGVFDFAKFSLSAGVINPWFRQLKIFGKVQNGRVIAIYLEPGVFFLAGVALILLHQMLGVVFVVSSIFYGLSWAAQYYLGDQLIMDQIDNIIMSEEMVDTFVHEELPDKTKGFEVHAQKPKDPKLRRKLAEALMEDEPAVDVI